MNDSDTPESVVFMECQFWVRAYGVPFRCFSQSTALAQVLSRLVKQDETDTLGQAKALRFKVAIPIDKPLRRSLIEATFQEGPLDLVTV